MLDRSGQVQGESPQGAAARAPRSRPPMRASETDEFVLPTAIGGYRRHAATATGC